METNKKKIETKDELIYVMQFYGVKQVPVREVGSKRNLGVVKLDGGKLVYEGGDWKYNDNGIHLAYSNAIRKFNEDIDKIEKWREIAKQVFETPIAEKVDKSWTNEHSVSECRGGWMYESDIIDSGVELVKDGSKFKVRGTLDQLRKFLSYAKNHLRYCNGETYVYTDEEVVSWMEFFRLYDLYKAYNSFSEYYHGGIVD